MTDTQPNSSEAASLRVLLIEDNPGDARLFEEYLAESRVDATLRHEGTLEDGLSALREGEADVVVLDLGLPDSQGPGTVAAAMSAAPEVPIVVLTGQDDLGAALQAQQAGAAQYLQKGELTPALAGRTLRWAAQRSRMQQKLRQRDAWVRSITEGLSAGVFRAGPTGRIEYANEALVDLLGLESSEQLIGRDLTEFYVDPFQKGRMLAEEGAEDIEVELGRPDESTVVGLLSVEPAYDANGRVLHYDGTITDITERKEKEEKLRLLSEAVEQAKESVLITEAEPLDEPGPRIEYVNEAFEEMTGYSEKEVLGETPRILQGPKTEREVLDSLRAALEAGEETEEETVNYRKDGTPYLVQWNIFPVRGEEGEIEHWVSVQRDVTEQREQEAALRRQKNLLEQTQRLAGAWEADLRTGEVSRTDEVYRIHGAEPGADLGDVEESLERFTPQARPKIREAFRQCAEEEEPYDLELPIETVEGNRRWVRTVGAPAEKEGEETVKVAGALQDITERKESEEALREQEARLRGLANSIPGVVFQFFARPDGTFGNYFVSEQAGSLLGISASPEGFHQRFVERVPEPHRETLTQSIEEAVQDEEPWEFEMPFEKPSGEEIWLLGASTPERREGELVYNGVFLDIDERKRAEKSLREREAQLRGLTNNLPGVVFQWYAKPDGGYGNTFVSDRAEEILGISADTERFHERFVERIPQSYREDVMARADHSVEKETSWESEMPFEKPSGERIWLRGISTPEQREEEGLVFNGVLLDITERKEQEEKLRRSKKLLHIAEEMTGVGGWSVDLRQEPPYRAEWTEKLYDIFGVPKEKKPPTEEVFEQFHAEDRDRHREVVMQAQETGTGWDKELRLAGTEEGQARWVRDIGRPTQEEGEIVEIHGAVQDITEQKRREQALREAKEEAEAADRLKSAFLAAMSHEIRTPLTSILGFAEAIGEEARGASAAEEVDLAALAQFSALIEKSGKRLMDTLTGVLNLSKLEAGEMDLGAEPVDLAEQAEQIAEELRPQAEGKGLCLQVQAGEKPIWAQADAGGVHIVLGNLMSNAIKYTEEGEVRVRASQAKNEAVLEVEDTGVGMDPSRAEDLFEPFRQASEGMSREYEGTGLGLAVTKEAAEQMGGTIEVETEKGEGSRFTVRLPIPSRTND
ncbi:MAG: hypothetical protein BRD42_01100 [Bacteroidetes bacterium QS_3_64_15]|nr:MAG: hypothetical protein BRD42_01100 [Bacteroidetes bacterium QS_3_64_15]